MKKTVRENNAFNKNLTLVAMDEAHTVSAYRRFRSQFKQIGKVRDCFPEIPFAAFSATLPPHIVAYVRKVCKMRNDIDMITVNGRRSNIDILVTEQYSPKQLDQLVDRLIPSGDFDMSDIPQTLVFVDAVEMARRIAITLRVKLVLLGKQHSTTFTGIRAYYSSIDHEAKSKTEALVNNQEARIVVCTDSMSLGVDFAKIRRVIQWGVNEKLTMENLVQRIGRAARDQKCQGVAIVYCPFQLLKAINKDWKAAWNGEVTPIGDASNPPEVADKPSHGDLTPLLALPVLPETATEVSILKERLYEEAEKSFAASSKPPGGQLHHRTGVDKGVLWFLGTTGCRHRCLLSYMDFPDVFEDHRQRSWCCDNCAIRRESNDDLSKIETAGFSPASSMSLQTTSQKPKPVLVPRHPLRPRSVEDCQDLLRRDIETWRSIVWEKFVQRGWLFRGLPPEVLLPTKAIDAIVKSVRRTINIDAVRAVLKTAGFAEDESPLRPKEMVELFNVIEDRCSGYHDEGSFGCGFVNI